MLTLSLADAAALEAFALAVAFVRVGAIVMLLPGIGEAMVPIRVRLVLALVLTAAVAPQVTGALPAMPQSVAGLALVVIGEALVGLMIGLIARFAMSALSVAGTIIAMQTGLGFVQALDPTFGVQGAIVGTFLSIAAITFIFATGLHALLFGAILNSYSVFPPGAVPDTGALFTLALESAAAAFALGVQISAPFLAFGLVFYLAAGVLNKLVPQIQVFFVLMPANILIGLALLMLTIGLIISTFAAYFQSALAPLAGTG